MVTCTRRIQFCAGHRVMGHENKCAHLHGHNYVAFIRCEASELDDIGRVIDFSCIKDNVGGWIDKVWDHGFILNIKDRAAIDLVQQFKTENGDCQKVYLMSDNPTAENMAKELVHLANSLLGQFGIQCTEVTLWETENCYATYTIRPKRDKADPTMALPYQTASP